MRTTSFPREELKVEAMRCLMQYLLELFEFSKGTVIPAKIYLVGHYSTTLLLDFVAANFVATVLKYFYSTRLGVNSHYMSFQKDPWY